MRAHSGLLVAVLGPDGSGKTTVCNAVVEELAPVFGAALYLHFRPHLGRSGPGGPPVTEPHRDPVRGRLASLAKVAYYLLDFALGHAVRIRPALGRGTLVVFDRYFHDLLADPRRYRYGGPAWALRLGARLVPRPDLVVVLDAPPEVLHGRKQEVPLAELRRVRSAYRELVAGLPGGHVVDASGPPGGVVARVERLVRERAAALAPAGARLEGVT